MARLIYRVAERAGMQCTVVESCGDRELRSACRQSARDMVFLNAGGSDLEQVARRLRVLAEGPSQGAVVLTGDVGAAALQKLTSLGESLELKMAGALPAVSDANTLKEKLSAVRADAQARTASADSAALPEPPVLNKPTDSS